METILLSIIILLLLWTTNFSSGYRIGLGPSTIPGRVLIPTYYNPRSWTHFEDLGVDNPKRFGHSWIEERGSSESSELERSGGAGDLDADGLSCEDWDGDVLECRAHSCFYCCSDDLCYSAETEALDCFRGCNKYCNTVSNCNMVGCKYDDDDNNKCSGGIRGTVLEAVNICGEELTNFNGIPFSGSPQFDSNNAICVRPSNTTNNPSNKIFNYVPPEDQELYRSGGLRGTVQPDFRLQDGDYILQFIFAHTGAGAQGMNTVVKFENTDWFRFRVYQNDFVESLDKEVKIYEDGTKAAILGEFRKKLVLELEAPHSFRLTISGERGSSEEFYFNAYLLWTF